MAVFENIVEEKLNEPKHLYAEGRFAEDVCVERLDGDIHVGGSDERTDFDLTEVLGIDADKSGTVEQRDR